jgi:ribosomal protein S18 acetylase RimI-like enzyme
MSTVKVMKSKDEILLTFSTVNQLRQQKSEEEYLEKVIQLQECFNYTLVSVIDNNEVKAIAGYKILQSLAWGKYLYVDDFVTDINSRRKGYASILWEWLINQAKLSNCDQFHLDSAVHRFDAHRFYLKGRMDISCHHFQMSLN